MRLLVFIVKPLIFSVIDDTRKRPSCFGCKLTYLIGDRLRFFFAFYAFYLLYRSIFSSFRNTNIYAERKKKTTKNAKIGFLKARITQCGEALNTKKSTD